jgi:hypothetical protein
MLGEYWRLFDPFDHYWGLMVMRVGDGKICLNVKFAEKQLLLWKSKHYALMKILKNINIIVGLGISGKLVGKLPKTLL